MDLQNSSVRLLRPDNQVELLNVIDQLRSSLLSQHVSLPEIVVCGDTSCGKSSVLEALSGVEFPVGSSVCTQFPTELVLERSNEKRAAYSIRPSPERSEEAVRRLTAFGGELDSLTNIPEIINKTKEVMGIENSGAISTDVLRLEISGPDLPHLTLIDLPGLIHNSSSGNEVSQVENLVKSYMERDRSIILVVVSVRSNIRSQAILTLAKKCDPEGRRSIGLITKPDLLGKESDAGEQREFLDLARNQNPEFKFSRQWHVLRNRGSREERDNFNRATAEQDVFCKAPWNDLLSTQLGLESFRKSLCNTLLEHIRFELPRVVTDIGNEIASANRRIVDLGIVRATTDEQRRFLLQISHKYEQLVQAALNGQYLNEEFFTSKTSRLRAQIRDLTDAFDLAMHQRGHTHDIKDWSEMFSETSFSAPGKPKVINRRQMIQKVEKLLNEHRGVELPGMFNPLLVGKLFKEESVQWRTIAIQYATDVCSVTRAFLKELISFISPSNTTTSESILREVFDVTMHQRRQAIGEKTTELLSPYVDALPFSTHRRLLASLKQVEAEEKEPEPANTDPTAASNLLKWFQAYYNVALENFVDNMATLGVENCVLKMLPGLFSSETISKFDSIKLQRIGGETQEITSQRHYERQKLEILHSSLELCRGYVNIEFERPEDSHKGLAQELEVISKEHIFETNKGTLKPAATSVFSTLKPSAAAKVPKKRAAQPNTPFASPSSAPAPPLDVGSSKPESKFSFGASPTPSKTVAGNSLFHSTAPSSGSSTPTPPISSSSAFKVESPFGSQTPRNIFGDPPTSQKWGPKTDPPPSERSTFKEKPLPPCLGTVFVPWTPTNVQGVLLSTIQPIESYQNISFQLGYKDFSTEELRLADYSAWRRFGDTVSLPGSLRGLGSGTSSNPTVIR